MPRLLSSFLRYAHHVDSYLPLLLRTCRNLPSARNELRWLKEHVKSRNSPSKDYARKHLKSLCVSRARGKPLQYILGNQPVGDLEIKCQAGVLIPRTETEAYTTHLAQTLLQHFRPPSPSSPSSPSPAPLRILDLCTGTGCIALLLYSLLSTHLPSLSILGIDISSRAIALAKHNRHSNIRVGHLSPYAATQIRFSQANVFHRDVVPKGKWSVLVANPPYISPSGYERSTARSVRSWEPKKALVPPQPISLPSSQSLAYDNTGRKRDDTIGDAFYPRLLEIAQNVDAQVVLVEVADMAQAQRVAALAIKAHVFRKCEIWRDWPQGKTVDAVEIGGRMVEIRGEGEGRAVMLSETRDGSNETE